MNEMKVYPIGKIENTDGIAVPPKGGTKPSPAQRKVCKRVSGCGKIFTAFGISLTTWYFTDKQEKTGK